MFFQIERGSTESTYSLSLCIRLMTVIYGVPDLVVAGKRVPFGRREVTTQFTCSVVVNSILLEHPVVLSEVLFELNIFVYGWKSMAFRVMTTNINKLGFLINQIFR